MSKSQIVENQEPQIDNKTLKFCNLMLANSLASEITFLKSNDNINKNGVRNLIKLEDITFKTFVRGIKAIATPLEDVEQIEAFVYKATEKYIERLRVEELLVEKANSKSQTRHAIDMRFADFCKELKRDGLIFEDPTNAKKLVYAELSKGVRTKGTSDSDWAKKPLKMAYKGMDLQCPFVEFEDKVKMVQKVVGTTSK